MSLLLKEFILSVHIQHDWYPGQTQVPVNSTFRSIPLIIPSIQITLYAICIYYKYI